MTVDFLNRKFYDSIYPTSVPIVLGFFDDANDKYYLQKPGQTLDNLMKYIIEQENVDVNGRELITAIESDTWYRYKMAVLGKNGKIIPANRLSQAVLETMKAKDEDEVV